MKEGILPRISMDHVPEHIRIDRLTTKHASKRGIRGPVVLTNYNLYDCGKFMATGPARDICDLINVDPAKINTMASKGTLLDDRYTVEKVKE